MANPKRPVGTYKQNDLFRGDKDYRLNACVGKNGGPYDFHAYSRGYFQAGERLVSSLIQNHSLVDLVIYPVAFVFRHAVELGLKDLASCLPRLWNEAGDIRLTHKLLDNWFLVKPYIMRPPVFDPDEPVIESVESLLRNLVEIDPSGEAFRFPTARDGSYFLQETSLINVRVFASALSTVDNAFDFWHDVAHEAWTSKCEYEADFRNGS